MTGGAPDVNRWKAEANEAELSRYDSDRDGERGRGELSDLEEELGVVAARRERRKLHTGQAGSFAATGTAHATREVTGQDVHPVPGPSGRDGEELHAGRRCNERVIAPAASPLSRSATAVLPGLIPVRLGLWWAASPLAVPENG